MKRIFCLTSLILCLAIALCTVSCGKKEEPYRDSGFVGEWKANSIETRDESVINYRTLTIKLEADGSCSYDGSPATWVPDEENGRITIRPASDEASFSLNIVRDGDKVMLKYRIDTYYKASEFTPKDSETVSAVTGTSGTHNPDDPDPILG